MSRPAPSVPPQDGVSADAASDPVAAVWTASAAKAAAALAAAPAAKPLLSAHQVDLFKKRFGYVDDAVTPELAAKAAADPAATALLTGKVRGVHTTTSGVHAAAWKVGPAGHAAHAMRGG